MSSDLPETDRVCHIFHLVSMLAALLRLFRRHSTPQGGTLCLRSFLETELRNAVPRRAQRLVI